MENKYKVGDAVFAKVNSEVILIVRRYVDRIYFCRLRDIKSEKDLVFFERELDDFNTSPTPDQFI